MRRFLLLLLLLLLPVVFASSAAVADGKKPNPRSLSYLTDGRGHYIAVDSKHQDKGFFYARSKEPFYRQNVINSSLDTLNGKREWKLVFWAPNSTPVAMAHVQGPRGLNHGHLSHKAGRWTVRCGERTTPLISVSENVRRVLMKRKLLPRFHKRAVYLVGRDDDGIYYMVDKLSRKVGGEDYRLFIGPAGAMKRVRLDDVITDVIGDVFRGKAGKLVRNHRKRTFLWTPRGKKTTEIFRLELDGNAFLIYGVLGVYRNRLGTPCDDL